MVHEHSHIAKYSVEKWYWEEERLNEWISEAPYPARRRACHLQDEDKYGARWCEECALDGVRNLHKDIISHSLSLRGQV